MNALLEAKLKTLPRSAGVYFHKDKKGEIIYVGKAAVLKNRVKQYFQSKRDMDVKTLALVAEIYDTDWIETESEIDALFLESEMVKRYKPRFNILLRDDKSQLFLRIDMKSEYPCVCFTRQPSDDGATYFGPYFNGFALRKALRYLRPIFPYSTHETMPKRVCLQYHLGLCPGVEEQKISSSDYKITLRKLIRYIEGGRQSLVKEIERDMLRAAKKHDFEAAAQLRNKLRALKELDRRIMFGDREFLEISKDHALGELTDLLQLSSAPVRIEGYDISHMSGTNVVASMVVFTNGVSDRKEYRKFKTTKDHNNDFFNMNETLTRRLSEKNLQAWGKPSLILIDGGKGQLDAALQARDAREQQAIPFIGLAKREEQIVIHKQKSGVLLNQDVMLKLKGYVTESEDFLLVNIPHDTPLIKLLQRIRDESHRFAVSYHTVLKRQHQTDSSLEAITGVGPKTRTKLLRAFGSVTALKQASEADVAGIVGPKLAKSIVSWRLGS